MFIDTTWNVKMYHVEINNAEQVLFIVHVIYCFSFNV